MPPRHGTTRTASKPKVTKKATQPKKTGKKKALPSEDNIPDSDDLGAVDSVDDDQAEGDSAESEEKGIVIE